ncbi:hypothetical protein SNEBB_004817 [Seison nebaliae]|nr:hypothetical protein SNEBB_004817 [Seison nebaliae]
MIFTFVFIILISFINIDHINTDRQIDDQVKRHKFPWSEAVTPVPSHRPNDVTKRSVKLNDLKFLNDEKNEKYFVDKQQIHSPQENNEADVPKREFIKQMMLHAWYGYKNFSWGDNELQPLSGRPHNSGLFGYGKVGATIIDALDTLFVMKLHDEVKQGSEWVQNSFNFKSTGTVSVFETNIRFIGGLLSMHALTGDRMFLEKAEEVAILLLPAFNTPTGIPNSLINPKTGSSHVHSWSFGGCALLAEFGSLSLEWNYLSEHTGKPIYGDKIKKIMEVLEAKWPYNGLFYNEFQNSKGRFCSDHVSLGALGDSFYEYLLKTWLREGKKLDSIYLKMYLTTMPVVEKTTMRRSAGGLLYSGEYASRHVVAKMGHLTCFIGGLFALTALNGKAAGLTQKEIEHQKSLAIDITHTCHESYDRSETKIGPEYFHFETENNEAKSVRYNERMYMLRPEVVESYFYLWRLTGEQKYRDWGWEAAQAIEKHCKVPHGYTGISNVYEDPPKVDDVQQSFFLAETLKYLYLLFDSNDSYPLNKWVFNTEAHLLPIK